MMEEAAKLNGKIGRKWYRKGEKIVNILGNFYENKSRGGFLVCSIRKALTWVMVSAKFITGT